MEKPIAVPPRYRRSIVVATQERVAELPALEELPRLGGALAEDAPPSLFDEVAPRRPIRLVAVVCAICREEVQISFLADGKLCDLCRMDLPMAASNIAADVDAAERSCSLVNEAWLMAHEDATPKDQDRYAITAEFRRTLWLNGQAYSEAQMSAALKRAVQANDGLSVLIQADQARRDADKALYEVRAQAEIARAELHAAGWRS